MARKRDSDIELDFDGLADSLDERYEIPLAAPADAARIVIRATDVMQNVASPGGS